MKKMISLSLVAAVVALSSAAFAAPIYKEHGHCNAFQDEQSVYAWSSSTKKFVLQGYKCIKYGR